MRKKRAKINIRKLLEWAESQNLPETDKARLLLCVLRELAVRLIREGGK